MAALDVKRRWDETIGYGYFACQVEIAVLLRLLSGREVEITIHEELAGLGGHDVGMEIDSEMTFWTFYSMFKAWLSPLSCRFAGCHHGRAP